MDVWTLGEKWKKAQAEIDELKSRIGYMEEYLVNLTEVKKDEAVPSKKKKSPGVRTRGRAAKKS